MGPLLNRPVRLQRFHELRHPFPADDNATSISFVSQVDPLIGLAIDDSLMEPSVDRGVALIKLHRHTFDVHAICVCAHEILDLPEMIGL